MRIAIISPGRLPVPAVKGGAVESLIDTFAAMAQADSNAPQVDIFSVNDSIDAVREFSDNHIRYYQMPCTDRPESFGLRIRRRFRPEAPYQEFIRFFCGYLKREEYDAVIIENRPVFVAAAARATRAGIHLHLHNENLFALRHYGNLLPKRCQSIITVSRYIKDVVDRALPAAHTVVLHNGIPAKSFARITEPVKREEIRKKYGIDRDAFVICYTGRLCREKGVLELVRAFSLLNEEKNMVLVIIGSAWFGTDVSDPYVEKVKAEVRHCRNRIVFTGYLDHAAVAEIEGIADVAVLPSIWDDPLPLAVLEAMASGLPVITTHAGGIPEMCTPDTGFLLERDERLSDNIAGRLVTLKNDPLLCAEMGQKARKRVEDYFSAGQYYRQFMQIIKQ